MELIKLIAELVAAAGLTATLLRVGLIARPVRPERLDDPGKFGFPMAGMMNAAQASAAINRKRPAARRRSKLFRR